MPELPEVQTVINGLIKTVVGKEISSLLEHRYGTVIWHCDNVVFGAISSISRRGKYIIIYTDNNYKIVIHLRMTGKLIFEQNSNISTKHTRAEILFSDNTKLLFNDVRTFGKIEIFESDETVKALENLGIEPLSEDFNPEYLKKKLSNKTAPIKNALLDQRIIAGLGNIYVCELLFRAKIDPCIESKKIKMGQLEKIVRETKIVLKEAIKHNGTTISDYRNVDDKTGEFQNFLNVYSKKKCKCGSEILRIKQAGRSTYYCPKCQLS
ncbi:bifunctional DNA-formamidopyrimidine glycosylase/DNA-(apurinic or apyrimidinic site) lyase [Candidatus Cloacimonadota bacterium]